MSVLRSLAFGLSLALSSAALAGAPGALASEGETAKTGFRTSPESEFAPCSGSSRVKVRVTAQADGRLEVVGVVFGEGEDSWSWKFKHDDTFSAKGTVRAKEREVDRSIRVVRTMVNFTGPDRVTFRAANDATGELCVVEHIYGEDYGRTRPRPPS